jgi:hypothetical protein
MYPMRLVAWIMQQQLQLPADSVDAYRSLGYCGNEFWCMGFMVALLAVYYNLFGLVQECVGNHTM